MIYLIILIAIALVLSPLIAMRPTQRQKQLSTFRLYARQQGVMVALEEVPYVCKNNSYEVSNCAVYRLLLNKEDAAASKPWYLFRNSQGQWLDELEDPVKENLLADLQTLSDDCLMIERQDRAIAAYWLEKGEQDQLDNLIKLLKNWKTADHSR